MTISANRVVWGLGVLALSLSSSCGLRPVSTPLGGAHVEEAALSPKPRGPAPASSALPHVEPETAPSSTPARDSTPPPLAPMPPKDTAASGALAGAGAFEPRPYTLHQSWTRRFDLEFNLKVGPGGSLDVKMVSHQEARFEVLGVTNGVLDKLSIEYAVYKSTLTVMGTSQDSPEELAGKRFVVTFARDKPDVREATGGAPPKKQADSVKDDAREPLEIERALKELAQLAAQNKGRAEFSRAGALALAGGEDEDTKVPSAKASLQQILTNSRAEKSAVIDLGYTMINTQDDKSAVEVQVSGSMSVLDAPARYHSVTLAGPMELRAGDAGGMQGRGNLKVTTSYQF